MNSEKPRLFIGSSKEAQDNSLVDKFVTSFSACATCIPWFNIRHFSNEGSATTFAALCEAANDFDFAIFILTSDDLVESRSKRVRAPRDNVIFELGLFLSAIGPERVMAYVQEAPKGFKIPSDLSGVHMPRFQYDPANDETTLASINTHTRGFAQRIKKEGFRKLDLQLAAECWFNSTAHQFEVDLAAAKLTRARATIGNWRVGIAARVHDRDQNMEEDSRVVYSDLRLVPEEVNENILLRIPESSFNQKIKSGDKIEARVILVPDGLDFDRSATLGVALKARCRQVERISYTTNHH